MRALVKKIVPRRILNVCLDILYRIYYLYYSLIFPGLIVRKNTSDKHVFRQIFITRDYSIPLKIKPRLIVDAGANVGYSSLWFSRKYPKAKIIAVEPEKSNYDILEKNTKSEKNIFPIKAGLWNKKTSLKIINEDGDKWGFQTKEDVSGKNNINTITIDEILKQNNLDKIDLLKIDIEGAEKELFSKNTEWLKKVDVLIIELHDWMISGSSDSFYSAINKKDWKFSKKGENLILKRK